MWRDLSVFLSLGIKALKTVHHSVWSREEETETQQWALRRGARGHPGDEWRLCAFITNLLPFHHQGDSFFILIRLSAPPAAPPLPTQLHILNPLLTSFLIMVSTIFQLFLCLILLLFWCPWFSWLSCLYLVLLSVSSSPALFLLHLFLPVILLHLLQTDHNTSTCKHAFGFCRIYRDYGNVCTHESNF